MDIKFLRYFPESIAKSLQHTAALYGDSVDEIRMYKTGKIVLVMCGKNVHTSVSCTEAIFRETVGNLCGHSLYAHEESIRQGYIFTQDGIRVGVAGQAVCRGDIVERITELTSLCIRIPRRFPGTSDDIYSRAVSAGVPTSVLVFSSPGVGKTTALRELADCLAKTAYRVALVDTRYELCYGLNNEYIDIFKGYPRSFGMETAIRVMNPQFVICDEISTDADAKAVLQCASSGVAVIASAHGGSLTDLRRQPAIKTLLEHDAFHTLVRLHRNGGQLVHTFYDKREGDWRDADNGSGAVAGCGYGCGDSAAEG